MRTANKVTLMYAMNGAYASAYTAARAFIIIDNRKVIYNLDCSLRAILFALSAAYATVFAGLANLSALIVA